MASKDIATTSQLYGVRDDVENIGRIPNKGGRVQTVQMKIRGEDLNTAAAVLADPPAFQGAVIPSGAHIESARIVVTEVFASASSDGTLTIGTYSLDGSAHDVDGIDVTVAISSVLGSLGTTVTCDGALVDTNLSEAVRLGAYWATHIYTAGEALVEVNYILP